uniref:Uncharacterized protein n=1 Tax=Solanum tuberosum TaxID=4113 RepID=M1DPW8_SOLTU
MMKSKEVMRVKVKNPQGMSHQGIDQEVNYCKVDQEVDWVQCHLIGDNMGTTLKVEINGKPMSILKSAKMLEKNMVTAIKGVITTMTKEEKVAKYKTSSTNSWNKNKGGAQTSSGWNKGSDVKKPYEKKPFEVNTPKYPLRDKVKKGSKKMVVKKILKKEDEFEDGEDEEPDLCVKEGQSVAPLYVVRRAMVGVERWRDSGHFKGIGNFGERFGDWCADFGGGGSFTDY